MLKKYAAAYGTEGALMRTVIRSWLRKYRFFLDPSLMWPSDREIVVRWVFAALMLNAIVSGLDVDLELCLRWIRRLDILSLHWCLYAQLRHPISYAAFHSARSVVF